MRFSHLFTILVLFILYPSVLKSQNIQVVAAKGIYTINDSFEVVESMVIGDGKIIFLGTLDSALKSYPLATVNKYKGYIYPGFIDAHCHLLGFAKMRLQANLVGVKSKAKVISVIQKFYKESSPEWVLGSGWDQNLWKSYPDLATLDEAYPNTPVFLKLINFKSFLYLLILGLQIYDFYTYLILVLSKNSRALSSHLPSTFSSDDIIYICAFLSGVSYSIAIHLLIF